MWNLKDMAGILAEFATSLIWFPKIWPKSDASYGVTWATFLSLVTSLTTCIYWVTISPYGSRYHHMGPHITIWVNILPYGSPYHHTWVTILVHHIRQELTRICLCQELCKHVTRCFFMSLKSSVSQPALSITQAGKPRSYDSPKLRVSELLTDRGEV